MLDGVSIDQLRGFIAAVDEGSFSAAARKLRRAQSAVSELVSSLEGQMGVTLFDRSRRYPKLTSEGAVLLADARGVVAGVDFMKARAKESPQVWNPNYPLWSTYVFRWRPLPKRQRSFGSDFPACRFGFSSKPWAVPTNRFLTESQALVWSGRCRSCLRRSPASG